MRKILEFVGKTLIIGLLAVILSFGFKMLYIIFQEIIKAY